MVRVMEVTWVIASPVLTIVVTRASASSARAVVTGMGPIPSISQRSPSITCPRAIPEASALRRTSMGLVGPRAMRFANASCI